MPGKDKKISKVIICTFYFNVELDLFLHLTNMVERNVITRKCFNVCVLMHVCIHVCTCIHNLDT